MRLVVENYYALVGERIDKDRLMQHQLPEALWQRVETFLRRVKDLPCWVDINLSRTVFGAKQNRDFWSQVFKTAKGPGGVPVLAKPLDLMEMIQEAGAAKRSAS